MKPVRIIQTLNDLSVAPRRGAWIETLRRSRITKRVVSHPAGVRGLKHHKGGLIMKIYSRTPRGCVD